MQQFIRNTLVTGAIGLAMLVGSAGVVYLNPTIPPPNKRIGLKISEHPITYQLRCDYQGPYDLAASKILLMNARYDFAEADSIYGRFRYVDGLPEHHAGTWMVAVSVDMVVTMDGKRIATDYNPEIPAYVRLKPD